MQRTFKFNHNFHHYFFLFKSGFNGKKTFHAENKLVGYSKQNKTKQLWGVSVGIKSTHEHLSFLTHSSAKRMPRNGPWQGCRSPLLRNFFLEKYSKKILKQWNSKSILIWFCSGSKRRRWKFLTSLYGHSPWYWSSQWSQKFRPTRQLMSIFK